MTASTEVRLVSRPQGVPAPDCFALAEVELPEPGPGQLLVRNTVLSVDPYMRGRMNDAKSYAPPYALGEAMYGGAVGEVLASNADGFAVGDHVVHNSGWRTHAVVPAEQASRADVRAAPASAYLGVLGMPGLTAYIGVVRIAAVRAGDTVFVSGAAGAVGSTAGQLARLRGAARVVGSAGSAEKVRRLVDDFGYDAAFNYKNGPVAEQLAAAAPDGIDVYFDNVGGEHLEAAIASANVHARFAICGSISQYNATTPNAAPRNLSQLVAKRLTLQGFLVSDHADLRPDFLAEVAPLVGSGAIAYDETAADGIENAVQAFLDLLAGANTGKMVVRL